MRLPRAASGRSGRIAGTPVNVATSMTVSTLPGAGGGGAQLAVRAGGPPDMVIVGATLGDNG